MGRDSVATFNVEPFQDYVDYEEPKFDAEELSGIIPAPEEQHTMDMYKVNKCGDTYTCNPDIFFVRTSKCRSFYIL